VSPEFEEFSQIFAGLFVIVVGFVDFDIVRLVVFVLIKKHQFDPR
jgi:hypothetical protein